MSVQDISQHIRDSVHATQQIPVDLLQNAVDVLVTAYKAGHKLILAGNGGSAADAQHIAAEFVGRFIQERDPLPAIALPTNSSTITAIGNDYGFSDVFSRQLQAFAQPGDVFLGISTSGNSENLVTAFQQAEILDIHTIALTGHDGGKIGKLSDTHICIPVSQTPRIQEAHIVVGHIICDLVEKALFVE